MAALWEMAEAAITIARTTIQAALHGPVTPERWAELENELSPAANKVLPQPHLVTCAYAALIERMIKRHGQPVWAGPWDVDHDMLPAFTIAADILARRIPVNAIDPAKLPAVNSALALIGGQIAHAILTSRTRPPFSPN